MRRIFPHFLILLAAVSMLLISCGDERITPTDQADGVAVNGVLFYNSNNGSSLCYFTLKEDGDNIANANVAVEGTQANYVGEGTYMSTSPVLSLDPGETQTVTIVNFDGDTLLKQNFVLPDTFSAVVTDPANHIHNAGGNVALEWNGSAGALSYVVSVVPQDSGDVVVDYAAPAIEVGNTWTIPPIAFQKSDGTWVPDTYNIYVLALSTRQTFYEWPTIFFPVPSSYTDNNISEDGISGRIGVGTLSVSDYVITTTLK